MRSNTRLKLSPAWAALILIAFAWALAVCFAEAPKDEKPAGKELKSNVNSLCYVCHLDLQTEKIATVHLKNSITCDKCHGPSTHHMHDEMLMTKPDVLFGRAEVDDMCRSCHQDHKNPQAVEAFRKEWLGRKRANGRAVTAESICTDCHGTHNIVKKSISPPEQKQSGEWVSLFNGRDLAGWTAKGRASWTVKARTLIAKPVASGALWAQSLYEDYLLTATFRATWPIHAGIWLRAADPDLGPRVEIFDSRKPLAFTGSVWVAGKGLAVANLREDLAEREGWNTISVKVQGDRIQVWLNGEEVGVVHISGPAKGRIGLHIEGHPASKTTELCVREVLVQRLGKPEENVSTPSQD